MRMETRWRLAGCKGARLLPSSPQRRKSFVWKWLLLPGRHRRPSIALRPLEPLFIRGLDRAWRRPGKPRLRDAILTCRFTGFLSRDYV